MYNGVGLQTARGSGTNGYVQVNLANALLTKKRVSYNSEADIKRAEAELNRQPNQDILEHNRKRQIELKCADLEMLMETEGFDDETIQKKVGEYRELLQRQVESGELNIDVEMDSRETHMRAKMAQQNRDRMRAALGIKKDFVEGTAFENMNKDDVILENKSDATLANVKGHKKTKESRMSKNRSSSSKSSSSFSSSESSTSSVSSSSSSSSSSESESDEDTEGTTSGSEPSSASDESSSSDEEAEEPKRTNLREESVGRSSDESVSVEDRCERFASKERNEKTVRRKHRRSDDSIDKYQSRENSDRRSRDVHSRRSSDYRASRYYRDTRYDDERYSYRRHYGGRQTRDWYRPSADYLEKRVRRYDDERRHRHEKDRDHYRGSPRHARRRHDTESSTEHSSKDQAAGRERHHHNSSEDRENMLSMHGSKGQQIKAEPDSTHSPVRPTKDDRSASFKISTAENSHFESVERKVVGASIDNHGEKDDSGSRLDMSSPTSEVVLHVKQIDAPILESSASFREKSAQKFEERTKRDEGVSRRSLSREILGRRTNAAGHDQSQRSDSWSRERSASRSSSERPSRRHGQLSKRGSSRNDHKTVRHLSQPENDSVDAIRDIDNGSGVGEQVKNRELDKSRRENKILDTVEKNGAEKLRSSSSHDSVRRSCSKISVVSQKSGTSYSKATKSKRHDTSDSQDERLEGKQSKDYRLRRSKSRSIVSGHESSESQESEVQYASHIKARRHSSRSHSRRRKHSSRSSESEHSHSKKKSCSAGRKKSHHILETKLSRHHSSSSDGRSPPKQKSRTGPAHRSRSHLSESDNERHGTRERRCRRHNRLDSSDKGKKKYKRRNTTESSSDESAVRRSTSVSSKKQVNRPHMKGKHLEKAKRAVDVLSDEDHNQHTGLEVKRKRRESSEGDGSARRRQDDSSESQHDSSVSQSSDDWQSPDSIKSTERSQLVESKKRQSSTSDSESDFDECRVSEKIRKRSFGREDVNRKRRRHDTPSSESISHSSESSVGTSTKKEKAASSGNKKFKKRRRSSDQREPIDQSD